MYFTELSTYIHQTLATQVAGVVLVPSNEESAFGDLYEIRNESDEIPVSCATVDDVEIVPTFTNTTLRIR